MNADPYPLPYPEKAYGKRMNTWNTGKDSGCR